MKLHGIISPVVTPMTADQVLGLNGLPKHIDFTLGERVHGIFVLGTTSIVPALSMRSGHNTAALPEWVPSGSPIRQRSTGRPGNRMQGSELRQVHFERPARSAARTRMAGLAMRDRRGGCRRASGYVDSPVAHDQQGPILASRNA